MIIPRETLEEFFADTREQFRKGDAAFNIDEVCLWSFYFVDPSRDVFGPLAAHLEAAGYAIMGVSAANADEGDSELAYALRADRVERLTVEELLVRNSELSELAVRFGVEDYDGMDVGEVGGS
jgi:hypothetical protein